MNLIYYSEHKCCLEYKEQTALLCEICNEAYCTKCSNEHVNKEWAKSHTFIKIGNLKREDIFDKLNNTVIRCERIEEILIHPLIVANNFPFLSLDRKINEIFKNTKEIAKDHKFIISFIEEAKKIKKEEDVMKMKKLLNILENYANYFDLIGVISELRGSHLELNDLIVEKQNELTVVNFLLNDTLNKIAIHKILLKKIKDYVCQWNKQFEDILNSFNKSFTALYKQSKCCFKKEFDQVINMINEQKIVCKELDLKKEKAKKTLMDLDEKIKEAKEELRELEEQNTIIDYDMQVKDDELKEIINKTEELRNEYEELYLKNSMDRIHYEALSENLNELKEEVRVKEEEYIKVKENVKKINDEKEKLEPMENKIETIKSSLINILLMKGTLKELENKIEILEERKKKAEESKEGKVYKQELEIKKPEANEEDLETRTKKLENKSKALEKTIEEQNLKLEEVKNELEKLKSIEEDKNKVISYLNEEKEKIIKLKNGFESEKNELERKYREVETNYNDETIKLKKIQDDYKNLYDKTEDLKKNIEVLKEVEQKHKKDIEDLMNRIQEQNVGIVEKQEIKNQQLSDYKFIDDYVDNKVINSVCKSPKYGNQIVTEERLHNSSIKP